MENVDSNIPKRDPDGVPSKRIRDIFGGEVSQISTAMYKFGEQPIQVVNHPKIILDVDAYSTDDNDSLLILLLTY